MSSPQENETTQQPSIKRTHLFSKMIRSRWFWLVIVVCIVAAVYKIFLMQTATQAVARAKAQSDAQRPLPVVAVAARKANMDVNLRGLGTVIPVNTVTVRSQVSGQLLQVHFKEGQIVEAGTLLAEIDPRPFEVQLMQAEGQLARDEALLRNAESDLVRYKLLLSQDSIADQQVTTQASLVQQYKGAIKIDQGQIANAKLQLTYSRVIAPISGRIGLRLVDQGNMIQSNDVNGMAVITQLQPVTVVFSVPQDNLPAIMKRLRTGELLPVDAYSQDGKAILAKGTLLAVDNQIDTTTGTVKLKAKFDNKNNGLFANQFVNVVMKVDILSGATVMPTAAIQRGSIGTFAYVVKEDKSVDVRPLQLGPTEGENVAVLSGLAPGEIVVVVGGDKLREGTKVAIVTNGAAGTPAQGRKTSPDGASKGRRQ
ncbi:MAG: MdtA/MuxA family multidrug efflux RND transporter periplasmic adaptor subunit [Deltaproteobacteria bacterium]|nr:MdtA/MuxA family multidrug efflux RND transporter periplasmic adaptor subunit [Deltaproteobacteria bacterium]